MTIKTQINIIRILSFVLGLASLFSILYFWPPADLLKFIIAFGSLIFIWIIGYRLVNDKLMDLIDNSDNPRKTFWELFRKSELEKEHLSEMPSLKHTIKTFQDNYNFFDENKRKIRFCINQSFVRIQDEFGKFITYNFADIDNIYIDAYIDHNTDSGGFPRLFVKINLKTKIKVACNIINIDCEIDEFEQIIEHFKKNIQ